MGLLRRSRDELEGLAQLYESYAAESLARALAFHECSLGGTLRDSGRKWAGCFADNGVLASADGLTTGFLKRMHMEYDSDAKLLDSISSLLVGKPIRRWDDGTVTLFDREVHDVVHRIEESALSGPLESFRDAPAAEGLAELAQARIGELFDRLVNLVGAERAEAVLAATVSAKREANDNGNH